MEKFLARIRLDGWVAWRYCRLMFKEFKKVSQEKTGWRRLFTDQVFDLYIWYNKKGGEITGLQLVELSGAESRRALTWLRDQGSFYSGVLTKGVFNATPLLTVNGAFRKDIIFQEFCKIDSSLPVEIRELARQVITDHRE